MAFEPLSKPKDGFFDPDNLPWANEYVKDNLKEEKPYPVKFLKRTDSGYMIVTERYKAMAKEGSSNFVNIEGALPTWLEIKTDLPGLFVMLKGRREVILGIDQEIRTHLWHTSEERHIQVLKKEAEGTTEAISSNPLLAGVGVHTASEKQGRRSK